MAINLSLDGVDSKSVFEEGKLSSVLDTGLYQAIVKYIYFTKTARGGDCANAVLEINGLTHTFPMYVTYADNHKPVKEVNGKKVVIPGYKQLNSLVYCACEKTAEQCSQEQKSIMIYDWKQRKEIPTLVDTITDVMNKPIIVGIKKVNKHKQANVNGQYVPTTETFFTNEVDRYYTIDGYLASEKASGGDPVYATTFKAKAGTVFEEKLKVTPIAPPTQASVATASNTPVKSLFDDE